MSIWEKYEKKEIMGTETYGNIFKEVDKKQEIMLQLKKLLKWKQIIHFWKKLK